MVRSLGESRRLCQRLVVVEGGRTTLHQALPAFVALAVTAAHLAVALSA